MFARRVSADESCTYLDKDIATNFVGNKRKKSFGIQSESIF